MRKVFDRRILISIWAGIFIMKLVIGASHLMAVGRKAKPFSLDFFSQAYRGLDPGTEKAIAETVNFVNAMLGAHLRRSQREHLVAAAGYLLAALTSALSLLLELRSVLLGKGSKPL